jgi:hypothetical protein
LSLATYPKEPQGWVRDTERFGAIETRVMGYVIIAKQKERKATCKSILVFLANKQKNIRGNIPTILRNINVIKTLRPDPPPLPNIVTFWGLFIQVK